ncbi:MAG: trehalose-6-phosphate synthase, partial [Actinomycetota bacterium]|nr:trehalose-6-phosphate synthase [Actinomycetota bacterium]
YEVLNYEVAMAVADAAPLNAVVLVQDYHFALVAADLADRRPDLDLVHFSHTPFGGPEALSVLPTDAAQKYLRGMGAHAACGFHTERWRRRFEQSCDEFGIDTPPTFVSPLPPDIEGIESLAGSEQCEERLTDLAATLGGRSLVLTSGRLELSKNLQRAMFGFEELLVRRPDLKGEVVFAAFVYPSREGLVDYQAYRQECEGTAERINQRFGTTDWTPVWFDTDDDLPRSIAGLRMYDVLLINPIRDGLNLVAFEGPLVNERSGVLALSIEAGAAELLAEAAITLHPFDINDTAAALAAALDMSADERRSQATRLRSISLARGITDWYEAQLNALS